MQLNHQRFRVECYCFPLSFRTPPVPSVFEDSPIYQPASQPRTSPLKFARTGSESRAVPSWSVALRADHPRREMPKGKLLRWHSDKGFGFIQPDDGGEDLFSGLSVRSTRNRFFILLHRARSRLYRRRSLKVNTSTHFSIFSRSRLQDVNSFAPLQSHNLAIFRQHF